MSKKRYMEGRNQALEQIIQEQQSQLETKDFIIDAQTKENDEFLKRQKGFGMLGTGGDLRRMFAAAITSVNMIPEDPAVFGALSGTVLAVILAIEIAIMISVISATSHASSSSSK